MPARGLVNMLALDDITHRERGPHEARARKGGLQYRCADDTGNAQLVHHVGNNASRISKGAKPFDDPCRWSRRFHHANPLAGDFPSQLFFSHRNAPSPLLTELSLWTLVSFGSQLIKNRQVHKPIRPDRTELFVHVSGHPDQILDRLVRWIKCGLRVGVKVLVGEVHHLRVIAIQQLSQRTYGALLIVDEIARRIGKGFDKLLNAWPLTGEIGPFYCNRSIHEGSR